MLQKLRGCYSGLATWVTSRMRISPGPVLLVFQPAWGAFRAPRKLIKRLDRLGLALQKSEGIPARRSVVIRRAVLAGLPQLEDEALSLLTDELERLADAGEAAE